jgi:hypothetical protein
MNHKNAKFVNGLPVGLDDQTFYVEFLRDFRRHQFELGNALYRLYGTSGIVLGGCLVTPGSLYTLNITSGVTFNKFSVTNLSSTASWAVPQAVANEDIYVEVPIPAITGQAIIGATTDNTTTNYVKVAYLEADGQTRNKRNSSVSYAYETADSYVISTNSTMPTPYETVIATFVTNGTTITMGPQPLGRIPRHVAYDTISASKTYPQLQSSLIVSCNNGTAATIDISNGAQAMGSDFRLIKQGVGVLTLKVSNSISYAIPIGNVYFMWDGTAWQQINNTIVTTTNVTGLLQPSGSGQVLSTFAQ